MRRLHINKIIFNKTEKSVRRTGFLSVSVMHFPDPPERVVQVIIRF